MLVNFQKNRCFFFGSILRAPANWSLPQHASRRFQIGVTGAQFQIGSERKSEPSIFGLTVNLEETRQIDLQFKPKNPEQKGNCETTVPRAQNGHVSR